MNRRTGTFGTVAIWTVTTIVTLVPIYWMFLVSGKSRVELFARPSFVIKSFFEENYIAILEDETFRGYMINSLIVATANAVLVNVLALMATYAMSRFVLKGKENVFFWLITNRMAPPAVFLLPLFLMFTRGFAFGNTPQAKEMAFNYSRSIEAMDKLAFSGKKKAV